MRFLARGFRATGLSRVRRHFQVSVTSSPIRSRGCAEIGGSRISLAIATRSRFSLRRLARLFEHEAWHLKGKEHQDMSENQLYSLGAVPRWARGLTFRFRKRAPNQMSVLRRQSSYSYQGSTRRFAVVGPKVR